MKQKFKIDDKVIWKNGSKGYLTKLKFYTAVVKDLLIRPNGHCKYYICFLTDGFCVWLFEKDLLAVDECCYQIDFLERINDRIK